MKHSIKLKFTVIFIGIMVLILLLQILVNGSFLERYYISRKVDALKQAYVLTDELIIQTEEDGGTIKDVLEDEFGKNLMDSSAVATIRELGDVSNINIVIIDRNNDGIIVASREGDWLVKKLRFYLHNKEAILNGKLPGIALPEMPEETEESGVAQQDTENTETTEESSLAGQDQQGTAEPGEQETESASQSTSTTAEAAPEPRRQAPAALQTGPQTIYEAENYCIQVYYDFRSETSYLESWGTYSDGQTKFLMSMPIASIRDSVALTNQFLLIVGAFLLLFGSIIIYLAARAITKPINQLAAISKRMTALDFSARYEGKAKNEIGVLGDSMNRMSETLEKTIAELKTSNNKLQQDIDEKTKIDETRKEFIINVSHELKTPLALIEGYAEGLVEGMASDQESRDYYCGVIMDEAIKMNRMLKQLTSLSNIELGADHTEFGRFDAAELIRSVAEAQKITAEEQGAKITLELPQSAYVWADEFKIEEVVTNYLTNALHHVAGAKRIIVRAQLLEEGAAEKLLRQSDEEQSAPVSAGEQLLVSVYNDGSPIPEEDIERIWDKFYKVDKARTRAYGGSGIGLSIVKAIIASHHQSCGVRNEEEGVTFWFTLDAAQESCPSK